MPKKVLKVLLIVSGFTVGLVIYTIATTYITSKKTATRGTYLACGCGCCTDVPSNTMCLYKSKGDDLADVIYRDSLVAKSPTCELVGCSAGTLYSYCD